MTRESTFLEAPYFLRTPSVRANLSAIDQTKINYPKCVHPILIAPQLFSTKPPKRRIVLRNDANHYEACSKQERFQTTPKYLNIRIGGSLLMLCSYFSAMTVSSYVIIVLNITFKDST